MPLSDRLLKVENVEPKTMTHAPGTMPAAHALNSIREDANGLPLSCVAQSLAK